MILLIVLEEVMLAVSTLSRKDNVANTSETFF